MRDHRRQLAVRIEHHPICARTASIIRLEGVEYWELEPGSWHRKVKAFTIIEGVGVGVAAFGLAGLVELASFGYGGVDCLLELRNGC